MLEPNEESRRRLIELLWFSGGIIGYGIVVSFTIGISVGIVGLMLRIFDSVFR